MTLSICMIVRDEEDYLPDCLDSIAELADELIVVDTGSTDQTLNIAESYGARIFQIDWEHNFAVARNYSLARASGDWIFVLDADERLPLKFHSRVRGLLKKALENNIAGWLVQIKNYYGSVKSGDYVLDSACRIFRNQVEYRYSSPLHEEMSQVIQENDPEAVILKTDIYLEHLGYLDQLVSGKRKSRRNTLILEKALKKAPCDPFLIYAYGTELFQQNNYQGALQYYKKITANLAELSFGADLLYKTVTALLQQEEYIKGMNLLKKGLKLFPDFQALWFVKGEYHLRCNEFKKAIAAYHSCLQLNNNNNKFLEINGLSSFRTYHALARVYEMMGEDSKAIDYYLQALRENPGYQAVINGLKGLLIKIKKRAIDYLDLSKVAEKYDPIYDLYREWLMDGELSEKIK
ncbi:glycosyltransferase [Iocasia frigidifontis]|uniref:Glycosyltransferase n=1 Tax=Iocasia fonsfrigidae TaxID=2682810 RepID=A0A8A7KBM8_9FIRM|nr:glycosyltransferase family 2 protein [Iocasia fonsfrigidae]QTL96749.1 glycosyltransferase [Iocasia fonsfrigidae]